MFMVQNRVIAGIDAVRIARSSVRQIDQDGRVRGIRMT